MADLIAPLRAHAPFDEMEPAALQFLARHLALGYQARGEVLVGPDSGVVDRFASAQLLLVVLAEAGRQGVATLEDLRSTERGRRWL